MTVEKLNNGVDWMDEQVKKPLKNLKNEVKENKEVIPPKKVNEYCEYFYKLLEIHLPLAKEKGLTSKEEGIVKKVVDRFVGDIKKHPNAYIMSVKEIKKHGVPYMTSGDNDKFGFIENYDLRNSLGAEFKITDEEDALFEKYHILYE